MSELEMMKQKFQALYYHTSNLAEELTKKEAIISVLVESEEMAQQLYKQQKSATNSLWAMVIKEGTISFTTAVQLLQRLSGMRCLMLKPE